MKIFLSVLTNLALLGLLVSLIVFVIRAIQKKNKKRLGVIVLISFGVLIIAATIGSQLYPVEDTERHDLQESTHELAESMDETKKVAEVIITPKNGKKLKVGGEKINFRINEIKQDTLGLIISLSADAAIPWNDITMEILTEDKQKVVSSSQIASGLFRSGKLLNGSLNFTFSTKIFPQKVIVYNKENKSIEFKVKAAKTK